MQEIGRELNTIASKAQDAGWPAWSSTPKPSWSGMREQAQNVE
jgi:uncharacterized protein YicC (UPF0701 family)